VPGVEPTPEDLALFQQKRDWYERNDKPENRERIMREFAARRSYVHFPLHGEILEGFDSGRLQIGENTHLEPHCWITMNPDHGHVKIGSGCFLNLGTMIAAEKSVTIGDHCMFGNGFYVGDADHHFTDPNTPVTQQGFTSEGPTSIGDNCWFGVHCAVLTGVTVGNRVVVGSNSVVIEDLPDGVIAAGVPARVIREIEFEAPAGS
jgi:acetyltransferase-like isoleucine patch superfamily enzyme